MTISKYEATIVKNRLWNIVLTITDPAVSDLSDFEFKAQFKTCDDCDDNIDATVTVDLPLTVKVALSAEKTGQMTKGKVIGELSFTKAGADPVTLFFIEAEVINQINNYDN